MKRSVALLAVAGLFVVGVLSGALGAHLYHLGFPGPPHPGPFPDRPGPGPHPDRFDRLALELRLSPEQRERIELILEEAREESRALRREMEPRVREQMERTRRRIEEVLTPEQRERFDRMRHRQRRRMERFFLGP